MSQFKSSDFSLLLEVFWEGLLRGLISRDEVVAWADQIISAEDEPDYFFIEISLSGNTNNLLGILGKHVVTSKSIIPVRVVLSLISQKLADLTIDIKKVLDILNEINADNIITSFEKDQIYYLDDQRDYIIYCGNDPDYVEITKNTMEFVSHYSDFNLTNYNSWTEINQEVEEHLEVEEAEQTIASEILMAGYAKQNKAKQRKIKIKRISLYVLIGILILAAIYIVFVVLKVFTGRSMISSFEHGLFSVSGGAFYAGLRIAYVLWTRVRVRTW
ncbi:hypothetical protein [Mucilaginibacter sp.]|uniref:hypothetical protein n=1 Tax=Mucilaginibacter sp. TaxID=1882438 RepID=UPI0026109A22|nr:hypothetical protein [Mucilaginibacter sp.]MDB4919673.1 hypothetical protein [Mucilaginibacter sp.]